MSMIDTGATPGGIVDCPYWAKSVFEGPRYPCVLASRVSEWHAAAETTKMHMSAAAAQFGTHVSQTRCLKRLDKTAILLSNETNLMSRGR